MFDPRHGPFWFLEFFDEDVWFVLVLGFMVFVLFLVSVSRVLSRVPRENRRIEPEQVWLNLIPILNFVWLPVTVERVGESLRNEFQARGRDRKSESYGKTAGLTALVLFSTALIFPPAAFITWPFASIYLIVYWLQLGWYARRLRSEPATYTPPEDEGW
jgi:hypothetical protein